MACVRLYIEWNIEFAFEGRRFWNLRRWMEAETVLNEPQRGWNILGKTNQAFYNNFQACRGVEETQV